MSMSLLGWFASFHLIGFLWRVVLPIALFVLVFYAIAASSRKAPDGIHPQVRQLISQQLPRAQQPLALELARQTQAMALEVAMIPCDPSSPVRQQALAAAADARRRSLDALQALDDVRVQKVVNSIQQQYGRAASAPTWQEAVRWGRAQTCGSLER